MSVSGLTADDILTCWKKGTFHCIVPNVVLGLLICLFAFSQIGGLRSKGSVCEATAWFLDQGLNALFLAGRSPAGVKYVPLSRWMSELCTLSQLLRSWAHEGYEGSLWTPG